ncbi:MAG: NYN domain-containing protein [Oscillospiraceae bacterium]|nr:NYN domain-containing protein [Oscillospiraceae bacterium]
MDTEKRIAVLIDADNVSDKYITHILDELSKYGAPTYKRIYGDWTSQRMQAWKSVLLTNSIMPIQQYSYTVGKNATDAALIIDAMDILYSNNVDSFCIVSSDSDFTRLAARLREAGMYVIGMGEKKTPQPFISACEVFKYLEVLAQPMNEDASSLHEDEKTEKPAKGRKKAAAADNKDQPQPCQQNDGMASVKTIIRAIRAIIAETSDEDDGWVMLGTVGSVLSKRYPDFDTRNYGSSRLSTFINTLGCFEMEKRPAGNANEYNSGTMDTYVRNRIEKSAPGRAGGKEQN